MRRAGRPPRRVRVVAVLAMIVPVLAASAAAYPRGRATFRLSVGLRDLTHYFPGMIGNGDIGTRTAPRGTEPTSTYMVGLMDRARGDIARPARLPGWNAVDFNPLPGSEAGGWLNAAALAAAHFRGYRQTLDLHDAILTTRYRYVYHRRVTAVRVVSFISEAQSHLGVVRMVLTPHYSGWVRLSFPVRLWKEHAPRFALARLSGKQVARALARHGLSLTPRAPATPDRAALWYPGHVAIRSSGAALRTRTLWLEGKARGGLPVALGVAVALPARAAVRALAVRHGHGRLTLEVSVHLERGKSYAFTKYVAMSRSGWGGNAVADVRLASAARTAGFAAVYHQQRMVWRRLWRADIVIHGDRKAQQVVHAALYYLLVNTTPDSGWAVGPCGLMSCYAGHVFWDSDTWVFPAFVLLHPQRARSLVTFRERTLTAAERRARAHGYAGAMYPWESDPYNGTDQTPYSAHALSQSEIHVNAEVAIAQWQYYLASLDRTWLRTHGWPVIRAVARFFTTRVTYDAHTHRYEILHVTSVSESHGNIPNDTYTNMVAAKALGIAAAAARVLGLRPDPRWVRIEHRMDIPVAADGRHHLPYQQSAAAARVPASGGGPLPLLFLPALDLRMPAALRRGDYDYAVRPLSRAHVAQASMGILPCVAGAEEVGLHDAAAAWLKLYVTGGTLKQPFDVRTETADNNVGPFLTGSAAYLQSLIYGLTGLRIRTAGLVGVYTPMLPRGWRSVTLRDVSFRGRRLDIRVERGANGSVQLIRRGL